MESRAALRLPVGLVIIVLAGVGCRTVRLSPEDRMSIGSVSLGEVDQAETISYYRPALEGLEPFPPGYFHVPVLRELTFLVSITPYGIWRTVRAYGAMEQAITDRMRYAGIDVAAIVRDNMREDLRAAHVFPEVVSGDADARLDLRVACGLSQSGGGLEPGVKPWLVVEGSLVDAHGRVVWRRQTEVSTREDLVPAYDIERYLVEPELFRIGVHRASHIAIARLLRDLAGG